jgi:membrane glycosyltransferase
MAFRFKVPLLDFELRSPSRITRRRTAVVTFVIVVTATGSFLMGDLLWGLPLKGSGWIIWALFTLLFGLLSFGASQAAFGFLARRGKGDRATIFRTLPDDPSTVPLAPTAIVLPVYNEEVTRVFAGLRALYKSIERTGQLAHFDFFILSDSTEPDQWIKEELAWVELCRELGARGRIFYRKRRINSNKKAGNLGDFLRRWGRRYRYMVVLDADSVMAGDSIVTMVRLMERNPRAGLIQSAPALMGAETFFARVLQFSSRLYGPIFLSGLNYWQQSEGNYWGHNAIIRVKAFIEHCALPQLPGREPFGGRILSHDFVEAALLRRAGYEVWLTPGLEGTYEELPPTLIDYAKRDRRWAQGNMQHVWLVFARGLHSVSRVHFAMGILAYSSSLFWFISLIIGTLFMVGFNRTGLTWIPEPGVANLLGLPAGAQAAVLALGTFVLLFLSKILAVLDLALQPGGMARFGGFGKVCAGVLIEVLFSILLAPVLMLFHSKFVVSILLGSGSVKWVTQRRESEDAINWREAYETHKGHLLLGLGWTLVLVLFAPGLLPWMSPVLLGMVLAIPFSALTAQRRFGLAAQRAGLLCTPDELNPPAELRDLHAKLEAPETAAFTNEMAGRDVAFTRAVVDPYVNAVHRCQLRDRPGRAESITEYFRMMQEHLLREGPAALKSHEKTALLADADSMDRLHREVWIRPLADLAPWWRDALGTYAPKAAA